MERSQQNIAQNLRPENLIVQAILGANLRKRLGHSLILSTKSERAPEFQDKVFALTRGLLCQNPRKPEKPEACGACESCLLIKNAEELPQHPDVMILNPDNARGYSVDSIRALIERFYLARSLSPVRVAVIHSAQLLSAGGGAAANALLKLLEEPRPDSYLMLLTEKPEGILPTIRSRSQHYRVRITETDTETEGWGTHTVLAPWDSWRKWILHGAQNDMAGEVPADFDEFWKDRDAALIELEEVYNALWLQARRAFATVPREQGLKVWDFFTNFDRLIASVRHFGSPALQWLSFRSRASLGIHGDH